MVEFGRIDSRCFKTSILTIGIDDYTDGFDGKRPNTVLFIMDG